VIERGLEGLVLDQQSLIVQQHFMYFDQRVLKPPNASANALRAG